jgi:hypothetical protein
MPFQPGLKPTGLDFTAYADASYHIMIYSHAVMENTDSLDIQCQ